jgi:hypothetical protein
MKSLMEESLVENGAHPIIVAPPSDAGDATGTILTFSM